MAQTYNIYCDESCHLEHDKEKVMLMGCVWCPKAEARRLSLELRDIKRKHNANGELKWVKTSISKLLFYHELIEWFFNDSSIHFRVLVVSDKSRLNHDYFNQGSHDTFYYKMYFYLLRPILSRKNLHNIFIDRKDTHAKSRIEKLKHILCNDAHDLKQNMVGHVQSVNSGTSNLLQLADFFMGAIGYQARSLQSNSAKVQIVNKLVDNTGIAPFQSTPPWEKKFNVFVFQPRGNGI